MNPYAVINVLAARQGGCWTVMQAVAAGLPERTAEHQVTRGAWVKLHRGVFAAGSTPPSWKRDLWAAYLFLDAERAVVGGRAAARLWRLPGFERGRAVELVVPRGHTPTLDGVAVKRTIHLPDDDIVLHSGMRTTSPTRTLHDLSAAVPFEPLLTAAGEAYRLGRTDPWRLLGSIHARRGLRGNRRLRAVVAALDPRFAQTRSVAEIVGQVRLRELGYTDYQVNVRMQLSSGRRVEVDVLFGVRRVLEINGARYHGSVVQRRHDAGRRADLEADDFVVRELWADELHDLDRVKVVVEDLLTAP